MASVKLVVLLRFPRTAVLLWTLGGRLSRNVRAVDDNCLKETVHFHLNTGDIRESLQKITTMGGKRRCLSLVIAASSTYLLS
jgi:hypothetical protein